MNDATTRSSSAASGASVGSARATAASPACHSTPCGPMNGRDADDLPFGDEERAPGALPLAGHHDAHGQSGAAAACAGSPAPPPRARRSGHADARHPRTGDRAQAAPALRAAWAARRRASPTRHLAAHATRAARACGSSAGPARSAARCRSRCRRAGGDRGTGRVARSARSRAAAARGSGGALRAPPRAPSRARATRPARARPAPPRPPAAGGPSGSTSAAAPAGRAHGRRRAPGRACRGRGRRRAAAERRRRGRACAGRGAAWSRRARRDRRPCVRLAPAPSRSAAAGSRPSPRRRAARDGRAARRSRSGRTAPTRFAGWRPSSRRASPTVSTTVAATRLSGEPHRLVVEERHVEARVVRDEHASPAKARKRRTAAATGGARRSCSSRSPVSAETAGCSRTARVRERLEPLGELEALDPHGAELARAGPTQGGGRSSRGRRRRTSPPRAAATRPAHRPARQVARPAQPRVGLHRLVEQRPGEPDGNGLPELQDGPCGLVGGNRAPMLLHELDEPVGGIEAQLHPAMLVRTYVRVYRPAQGDAREHLAHDPLGDEGGDVRGADRRSAAPPPRPRRRAPPTPRPCARPRGGRPRSSRRAPACRCPARTPGRARRRRP